MDVQKLLGERSTACDGGLCRLDANRQPTEEERRNFTDAYEKGRRGEDGRQEGQDVSDERKREGAQTMPSPSSLMESLFAGRMDGQAGVAAPEASPTADADNNLDKLVERILVAEPEQGAQEVRITLGEGILKGAELSIMRHADGQLAVRVSCMDAASFQTAVSARQGLADALESRGERVQVVVDRGDASDGNEGDTRRRSQGLQAMTEETSRS